MQNLFFLEKHPIDFICKSCHTICNQTQPVSFSQSVFFWIGILCKYFSTCITFEFLSYSFLLLTFSCALPTSLFYCKHCHMLHIALHCIGIAEPHSLLQLCHKYHSPQLRGTFHCGSLAWMQYWVFSHKWHSDSSFLLFCRKSRLLSLNFCHIRDMGQSWVDVNCTMSMRWMMNEQPLHFGLCHVNRHFGSS